MKYLAVQIRFRRFSAFLAAGLFLPQVSVSQQEGFSQNEIFPTIVGETLTGKNVILPQAFQGHPVWIMIGFTKDSQKSTSVCSEKLDISFKNQGYSIALIQGAPFFITGMIKNSICSTVPENKRERFFVLNEGREALQSLAGFEERSKDDAYMIGIHSKNGKDYQLAFKNHGKCEQGHLALVTRDILRLMGTEQKEGSSAGAGDLPPAQLK